MLRDNVDRINSLPIDHHLFAALIAPRGLFVVERWRILWLGPQTAFGCQVVGRKIHKFLSSQTAWQSPLRLVASIANFQVVSSEDVRISVTTWAESWAESRRLGLRPYPR
ncbi:hypothetical protein BKA70DRAFT_749998 [Coprinopsis sp. MPI-PUGE-AT-0042]|nr:hypothetical protein BKA70DRAFT_749998 [Coprinopsis sp. MPI-PUGE-AT-0042]